MWILIAGFFTAFFITLFTMPSLIKVSKLKHLVDEPTEKRKQHKESIPTIGGIVIFASIIFSTGIWIGMGPGALPKALPYYRDFVILMSCMILLFFIGIKDDIIGTAPVKKLAGHLIVAFILVFMGEIRINGFYGLFFIYEIPFWGSVLLSVFTYIVIVNALNLVDGIDGLAGGVTLIACLFFGLWFSFQGYLANSLIAFVTVGTMLGFLIFNTQPARVFMGDSGSLVLGLILSYLSIQMIESEVSNNFLELDKVNKPILAMAFLSYPLVDTIRVFFIRTIQGKSPFSADRQHIHHKLLRLGFSHRETSFLLYFYCLIIPIVAYFFSVNFIETFAFFIIIIFSILFSALPFFFNDKTA